VPAHTFPSANDELANEVETIHKFAGDLGLVDYPTVLATDRWYEWTGEWRRFLEIGQRVNAVILYSDVLPFDLDVEIRLAMSVAGFSNLPTDEEKALQKEPEPDDWHLYHHLMTNAAEWKRHSGHLASAQFAWRANGVFHTFVLTADWYPQVQESLQSDIAITAGVLEEDELRERTRQQEEEEAILQQRAEQLCNDPRFGDRQMNERRRMLIAQELFADLERPALKPIVDRATDIQVLRKQAASLE
jgi:hypothetical protein